MPNTQQTSPTIQAYINDMEDIIHQMMLVLFRAQRKVEDMEYRKTLEKLKNLDV